jgi:large subunit ribosomal protein L15
MPLHRRLPKRGFTSIFRTAYRTLNVERLNVFAPGTVVTAESLREAGLIPKRSGPIKILGGGELGRALTVRAERFTRAAARKIEGAGGKAEVVGAARS